SIPSRSHTSTRHKGKEIAKPITPPSETASEKDSDLEQAQRDKVWESEDDECCWSKGKSRKSGSAAI
nr:hypothetical protein [Tanacetum cinerariifolium]